MKPDFSEIAQKLYGWGEHKEMDAFTAGANHGYSLAMEQHRDFYLLVREFMILSADKHAGNLNHWLSLQDKIRKAMNPQHEQKDTYEFSQQKGTPGHCYQAQVFKNGKAFLSIEPTENEGDATYTAGKICDFLNESAGQKHSRKVFVEYANFWYEVADFSNEFGVQWVHIYDEPPAKHIDRVQLKNATGIKFK